MSDKLKKTIKTISYIEPKNFNIEVLNKKLEEKFSEVVVI